MSFHKTISMTLDPESVQKAIQDVENFQKQLKEAMRGLCERLLEEGVSVAKMQIMTLPAIDTGALMASIGHGAFDPQSGTGVIYCGAYYGMFVEYGTGIVGEEHYHPDPGAVGWEYDIHGHGESGWWYKPVGEQKAQWTKGMMARPFMYNTMLTLEDYVAQNGGEIIATMVR